MRLGLVLSEAGSGLRRNSMACVALPTCGLAMAESERYLPDLLTKVESLLEDDDRRVGLMAFREFRNSGFTALEADGLESFDLEYELRVGERVVAEAKTVLVAYDYETKSPKEIPTEWRQRLAA